MLPLRLVFFFVVLAGDLYPVGLLFVVKETVLCKDIIFVSHTWYMYQKYIFAQVPTAGAVDYPPKGV